MGVKQNRILAATLLLGRSLAAPALHGRQYSNSTCSRTTVAIMYGVENNCTISANIRSIEVEGSQGLQQL
jgi:hypothetical protein